jgi:hypothetical protein
MDSPRDYSELSVFFSGTVISSGASLSSGLVTARIVRVATRV